MSLLNRLWLSAAGAMLVALFGSFVISTLTARDYLAQQLFAQASDSAASLALSMSQQSKDAAMTELMVSALFDSGHFESVVYRDLAGKVLVERKLTEQGMSVPAWFVSLVPLDSSASGEALVSDGWKQAGKIEVRASPRFAYAALWSGALKLAAMLGFAGLLLCAGVAMLMRWAQRPLREIVQQAEAIGHKRFVMLPEPNVAELRVVGRAMNTMVGRVQAMFAEQAARIESLRNEANRDVLTQLPNRTLFLGALREALSDEHAAPDGVLVVVRVLDLAEMNRRAGRERADALLKAAAEQVSICAHARDREALVARLNGADFAVLAPGCDLVGAQQMGSGLVDAFDHLYRQEFADQAPVAAVGWTVYRHGESVGDVLVRADANVMRAESDPASLAGGEAQTRLDRVRPEEWRSRFQMALECKQFELAAFPVMRQDGSLVHHELMLRMLGSDGVRLTAGQFMPAASRLGLTAELDLLTLQLALARLDDSYDDVAINLSPLSLDTPGFLQRFHEVLSTTGRKARHLWVELSERGIGEAGGIEAIAGFANMLAGFEAKLGIEHFGRHFAAMPRLHALSVDYLKLDGVFVADIDGNEGNQRFVKAVVDVARSLDIEVYAERVSTDAEWTSLVGLGVSGMTGPIVTQRLSA